MLIVLSVAVVLIVIMSIIFIVLASFNIASLIIAIIKKQKSQIIIQAIELTLIIAILLATIILYILGGN